MSQDIHKVPLGVKIAAPGWTVYSVNGTAVRNALDPDFTGFAVGKAAGYVPDREIWIENTRSFEDMLHDVSIAEKHAQELTPVRVDSPIQHPLPEPLSLEESLSKVSNQRFWRGVRYITKAADWPEYHQDEIGRGVAAYIRSMVGSAPKVTQGQGGDQELLSWLFQSKEPTMLDQFQDMFKRKGIMGKPPKALPKGSETPNRIPSGEHWGKADQAGQGMGASGMGSAQSGPDHLLSNPSGWAR